MAEVTVRTGPLVPDAHTIVLKIFHVSVAFEKPQKFVDYRLEMDFLGGEQGKSFRKIKPHLMTEDRASAGAGAVTFIGAFTKDAVKQVEILLHDC